MVDVAEPSLLFIALCALSTESDLHRLRRLGRSCARCAELFWARDGKSRHRALQAESAKVASLNDDAAATRRVRQSADVPSELKPFGILTFIDIMDDVMAHGYLPFESVVLLARRTMQDDTLALLYLLVFAIVTDKSVIVDSVLQAGENWAEAAKLANSGGLRKSGQMSLGVSQRTHISEEDAAVKHPLSPLTVTANAVEMRNEDDDYEGALKLAAERYLAEREEFEDSDDPSDGDEEVSYEDDDGESKTETESEETQSNGDQTTSSTNASDDSTTIVDARTAAANRRHAAFAERRRSLVTEVESDVQRRKLDFFSEWWPQLRTENASLMRAYFNYLYPKRTKLTFDDPTLLERLTLAERLLIIATIWSSNDCAQLLLSVPEIRCNASVSVMFVISTHMTDAVGSSAKILERVERDEHLLSKIGIERLRHAVRHPCTSMEAHLRRIGQDAAFCEALEVYADEKQRHVLRARQIDALRPYLRTKHNEANDDDDAGDIVESPPVSGAPIADMNFSSTPLDLVEYKHVLWYACKTNNVALARQLVFERRCDAGEENHYAIRHAARHNAVNVLNYLLSLPGADASAEDSLALCWAIEGQAVEALGVLLKEKNVTPSTNDNFLLCRATELNNHYLVRHLVAQPTVNVNARDSTPLTNALRHVNVEVIEMLAAREDFVHYPRCDARFVELYQILKARLACGEPTAEYDLSDIAVCLVMLESIVNKQSK